MSNNQRYQRRAIDEAIDRAVGEMMETDPRPGLRRRVLSRIEKPFGRRSLWWHGSFVMLPAAALLLIIVAVVTSRWPESSVEVAQTSAPPAPLVPSAAPAAPLARSAAPVAPSAPVAPPAAPRLSSRSDALFGPRRDRVSAASIGLSAPASAFADPVPTIDEAGSLAPAPIVVSPLPQMQELRIAPIEIQRITVPALSPPR